MLQKLNNPLFLKSQYQRIFIWSHKGCIWR